MPSLCVCISLLDFFIFLSLIYTNFESKKEIFFAFIATQQ